MNLRPSTFLLPPLLVISGCGGGASGPAPAAPPGGTGAAAAAAADGPVIRWDPDEHGPLGVARAWADQGGYVNELKDILSGRDPRGEKMRTRLAALEDEVRRPEVLVELVDYYDKTGHPTLASVLRDFPRDTAAALVRVAEGRPEFAMRVADRVLFVGPEPVAAAWDYAPLRTTVARLCKRTEFEVADLQGGPARVWALKVAGKALVKEAKDGILLAAGYAKSEDGRRLPADPYGPAEAMATQIIRQKMRRKQ